jgi:hypothetical protein
MHQQNILDYHVFRLFAHLLPFISLNNWEFTVVVKKLQGQSKVMLSPTEMIQILMMEVNYVE